MKIIVIDLEYNQPSRSIIEIGAYCVDLKGQYPPIAFSQLVDPKEILDPRIIDLCGIKQEDVDGQPLIQDALESFWNWIKDTAQTKNVSAWGSDVYELIEASKKAGVRYPDRLRSLDIKEMASIFRSCYPSSKQKGGLLATMNLFGLEFEGRQHRALNDAIQTARLLLLLKENMRKFLSIKEAMNK